MKTQQRKILIPVLMATSAMAIAGEAAALEYNFYGSLRVQAEAVNPDNQSVVDSYTGFRDAYSRIGVSANHAFENGVTAYAKLEVPLDVANLSVNDPSNLDTHLRIAKIGIKGNFGDLAYGQMWMPYYNAIAYPVDMFSSYYSGWATYAYFRHENTLAYYTPSFNGFSAGLSYTNEADKDGGFQGTASYTNNGLTLSVGFDEYNYTDDTLWGVSASWQATENLSLAAKYEETGGSKATNLYAGYDMNQWTFKGMLADVEGYGETVVHLGVDYQYNDDLMLFTEYYSEETTAALSADKDLGSCSTCSGGDVFLIGVRYDFSSN